jgi:hypothetical protein
MTDLSALPARERAKRCRALAREAREKGALCTGEMQASFIKQSGEWNQLALEADAEAEPQGL